MPCTSQEKLVYSQEIVCPLSGFRSRDNLGIVLWHNLCQYPNGWKNLMTSRKDGLPRLCLPRIWVSNTPRPKDGCSEIPYPLHTGAPSSMLACAATLRFPPTCWLILQRKISDMVRLPYYFSTVATLRHLAFSTPDFSSGASCPGCAASLPGYF